MTRLPPSLLLAAFAACAVSEAKVPSEIRVELASVTLADNCPTMVPSGPGFARPFAGTRKGDRANPARRRCAGPNCPERRRVCEQTSMQIVFDAQPGAKPATIAIKKVELLDIRGNVLEVLTASAPTRWTDAGKYVAWDGKLAGDDTIRASYRLTAPNWAKLTNGRWQAHSHTFQLRVTVVIGTSSRTIEKQSITPARVAPVVVT